MTNALRPSWLSATDQGPEPITSRLDLVAGGVENEDRPSVGSHDEPVRLVTGIEFRGDLETGSADDADRAAHAIGDENRFAIRADRDIVRSPTDRDLSDDAFGLGIDHEEAVAVLAHHVQSAAVRRYRQVDGSLVQRVGPLNRESVVQNGTMRRHGDVAPPAVPTASPDDSQVTVGLIGRAGRSHGLDMKAARAVARFALHTVRDREALRRPTRTFIGCGRVAVETDPTVGRVVSDPAECSDRTRLVSLQ